MWKSQHGCYTSRKLIRPIECTTGITNTFDAYDVLELITLVLKRYVVARQLTDLQPLFQPHRQICGS